MSRSCSKVSGAVEQPSSATAVTRQSKGVADQVSHALHQVSSHRAGVIAGQQARAAGGIVACLLQLRLQCIGLAQYRGLAGIRFGARPISPWAFTCYSFKRGVKRCFRTVTNTICYFRKALSTL